MTEIEPLHHSALPDLALDFTPPGRGDNPYWVYVDAFKSEESARGQSQCLDRIAILWVTETLGPPLARPKAAGQFFPWEWLRFNHTTAIRAMLLRQTSVNRYGETVPWSAAYINKHLSALRKTLKVAWKLGRMSTDDYMRACEIDKVEGKRLPAGRSLAVPEFAKLLNACDDDSPAAVRDAAIVAVLQSTALRREEAALARREHYDPGSRVLRVVGKGNKEREVPVHETAADYLGQWLLLHERARGPLFPQIDRWGNIKDEAMSARAIGAIVGRRRTRAALPHLSTHDFRRTFAGDLLDRGVDLATVQQLMGHASPVTTAAYDRRPGRQRQAAVEKLSDVLPRRSAFIGEPLPHPERSEQ